MDRPIIFSAPMVRALLDGRKTQTRRVLKPPADGSWWYRHPDGQIVNSMGGPLPKARYATGDRLWVRESIGRRTAAFLGIEATNGVEESFYAADDENVVDEHGFNICPWWKQRQSLPSIHMPRWASRLTLAVTDVRVQRLQEISEEDARAEGATRVIGDVRYSPHKEGFHDLWRSLHGAGAWDANPWIIALTFTVEQRNIDA